MMEQTVPVTFFACSWDVERDAVHEQRACDLWVYDWPATDYYWLFGNQHGSMQPRPDFSPLARSYFDKITGEISTAIGEAVSQCEGRRYSAPDATASGLRLTVASQLDRAAVARDSGEQAGVGMATQVSVSFAPDSGPSPPSVCPPVPRELFAEPVEFDYVVYGPANGNFRWDWRDRQTHEPDPHFDLYGRRLRFSGYVGAQFLGSLHLIIDRLADLWVRFEPRPIPPSVADRVDPEQPLSYQISSGVGTFGITAVIEVLHVESGQIVSASVHGGGHPVGHLPITQWWPSGWESMSMDAEGVIRHHGIDWFYWIHAPDPAALGLPSVGTYRLRYILLAYAYQTLNRTVRSSVLGTDGDTRMSWKPIWLSHLPSLTIYTPGETEGIMPPFEHTYTRSAVLASGIAFDAVFDFKHLTTFRFVVKLTNQHDFAVGLVVQAAGWQTWVVLQPNETRYLAGAVSVSGLSNWNAYPLHPQSPSQGWNGNWSGSHISMNNGVCSIAFALFLTAPTAPDTVPVNLPSLTATQCWTWDVASLGPQHSRRWGAIKKFAPDARYDYEFSLAPTPRHQLLLGSLSRSITQPLHQSLLNPATYFVTGYDTPTYDWMSGWHQRPWPTFVGWSMSVPIMCSGERRVWNGSEHVWEPLPQVSLSLTRAMQQQVAAALGVTEYVVMDGDDIRWFQPGANGAFHNVLWIDRFYRQDGSLIDDAVMREAYRSVLAANASSWPNYRNLVVHANVRLGSFLDNGGHEVGDYLLGPTGEMVDVSSLNDLSSVSTRFLYCIRPDYR